MYKNALIGILFCFVLSSCDQSSGSELFEKVNYKHSGIDFSNDLQETPVMNIFNYMYFYNGGGVAAGDLNNDGLPDLYFTSNQDSNRLYINKGNFEFKDVTSKVKVEGYDAWATGVTIADVNGDGLLDIYVCYVGDHLTMRAKNQLFINKGNDENGLPFFEDQAEKFGLDISSYATQASFFDYDLDGDLDMFLLNHSVHDNGTFGKKNKFIGTFHPTAGDRLFRNDANIFVDKTEDSGIHSTALGYGLGVAHSDFNRDGYPDIYVANDFHEDDYLYLNNGDGTFTDVQKESLQHTSRFSMGVDIGDINNDGNMEIMTLDMLPEDPVILKASAAEDLYDVYHYKLKYGYNHQFARNNLQYNLGTNPASQKPLFSEIALYSGVAATDWSWSVLFADFDHDRFNDIFISNGILRRSNDLDYINYISHDTIQSRLENLKISEKDMALVTKMPKIKLPNYMYRNNGDLSFENMADSWGLSESNYSHGTVYTDLDADGDLDLVINNTEGEAGIYRNLLIEKNEENRNYLILKLKSETLNSHAIGSRVRIYYGEEYQEKELFATKGFQSSVEPILHFGLSNISKLDSVIIYWPNQQKSKQENVEVNQILEIKQSAENTKSDSWSLDDPGHTIFTDVTEEIQLDYVHKENRFVEFNREVLLPHMLSEEGPPITVADFNGDGRQDIFVGNAKREKANIFFQDLNGDFYPIDKTSECFDKDFIYEDVSSHAFDADEDGDLDLVVGTGGNEFAVKSEHSLQRLYLNKGNGIFEKDTLFVKVYQTNSDITSLDYDRDGDLDLLFVSRSIQKKYGLKPDSYLIENIGNGKFVDATDDKAPFLESFGFVQDISQMDINGDGKEEILFALEWDAIKIAELKDGKLELWSDESSGLNQTNGWWKTIVPGDYDEDGDMDFVAGNLGLNSKLTASKSHPLKMYYLDYDQNGTSEQVLCHYYQGEYRVFNTKDEIVSQLPELKKKFTTNTSFANAKLHEIFSEQKLKEAILLEAQELASCYFENDGTGKFTLHRLPSQCQFSTIETGIYTNAFGNKEKKLLLAGNFYPINIQMGRYDGNYGTLLNFSESGFQIIPQENSGLALTGECRNIAMLENNKLGKLLVISRNDDKLVFLKPHSE